MARLTVLKQDDGEELAVGEALDPDVEEQPGVAFAGGVFALEREGEGGGGEVDDEEGEEEGEQLVELSAELAVSGWKCLSMK